jgi:ubiquinone/menaquinone biosynthesis C-methylase UbiE
MLRPRETAHMTDTYVHGYTARERLRLQDQASALTDLLHGDTRYPAGSVVLEAGCGVGSQTVILARNSPEARFVSMDISQESLEAAKRAVDAENLRNVSFRQGDIFALPFAEAEFDHVFVCFVLEHLPDPAAALASLMRFLKPGGSITVIEGDHGSAYFYPDSPPARKAIQCLVDLQARSGGDALIGRRLYPLLIQAGFDEIRVSPRMVYADGGAPHLHEGFTKKTFTAMIEGARGRALAAGLMGAEEFSAGIRDLCRTAEPDGTFCYTFFKATGIKRSRSSVADLGQSPAN